MDHLFHKNLLAEKHNLEWELAQANLKIKNLQEQLNKLTKQTIISEEIVNPGTVNPNVPQAPNLVPQKPPFTRQLPDNTKPVPMPRTNPPAKPTMPSLDGILRRFRRPLIKETSGNPSGNPALANVESNITQYILENRNFIFQSLMNGNPHLFESNQMDSETAARVLSVILEDIMNDEQFIRKNYTVLSSPVLTEEAKQILFERMGIGSVIKKGIKKLIDIIDPARPAGRNPPGTIKGWDSKNNPIWGPPRPTPGSNDPLVRTGPKDTPYERIIRPSDLQ